MSSSQPDSRPGSTRTLRAPLVGRGLEMRELEEALARALTTRTPQVVTILGSAGVGKTRLLSDFLVRVRERERRVRVYRGGARENGPTFGVVQRLLRARFGILEGQDHGTAEQTFRHVVTDTFGDRRVAEFLHFLGAFLDFRFPDSPFIKAIEDDPAQFGAISRAVLRRFFEVDAEHAPLVLTFEDLHWASDDALDLVEYVTTSMRDAPVLIVHVARPELLARKAEWIAPKDRHTRLDLMPLRPDDSAKLMLHLLAPTGEPPDELVDAAVDMAGGSPYLLEQMVRTFFDSGTLTSCGDGTWAVDLDKLDDAQLPLTVDDAIAARIAALAPAERNLLEMAATMGGVFWLGALVALGRIDKPTPQLWGGAEDLAAQYRDLLHALIERDYILELPDSSIAGDREYAFKHNLERETLHKLASRTQARRYHLIVAEWLEFRLADRAEEQAEMLAQHYEAGGARRKAALSFVFAGDRARSRYANVKAAEYYARGLELLGEEDVTTRTDALHNYGDVLQLAGRNDDAIATFRKMLDIAYRLDLKAKGGVAFNRIGRVYRAIGQLEEAMRHLGTGLALFDAAGDKRGVASSLDDIGKVHWMRGAYEAAERFMKQGLEQRQELGNKRSIALSYNNLGVVYQDSGRFAEALEAFDQALALRREIGDLPGIAQTLNNLGTIHQDNGENERAIAVWQEALEAGREVGDRMRQAVILTNLGEMQYRLGQASEAIKVLKQAEDLSANLGDRILEGEILRGLAKAHMLVNDLSLARDYINRSIALFEQARGKPFLGVALRTLGEICASAAWGGGGGEADRARAAFERSMHLFEELGNEIELSRTSKAFAKFLASDPNAKDDPARAAEIAALERRADEIVEKLRHTEEGVPVDVHVTQPGLPLPELLAASRRPPPPTDEP